MFNDHILEYLLNLSTHSVPNIRLYAGRCLSKTVLMNGKMFYQLQIDITFERFIRIANLSMYFKVLFVSF